MMDAHLQTRIKAQVAQGCHRQAFDLLCQALDPSADYPTHYRLVRLFNRLDVQHLGLTPLRVAILGTSTLDHFLGVLRLYLARDGFDANVFSGDFATIAQTVLDPRSALYAFQPEIVWFFTTHRDVPHEIPAGASVEEVVTSVETAAAHWQDLWRTVQEQLPAYIIQNNADLPLVRTFGHFEGTAVWGRANVLRRFNLALAQSVETGVTLFDLDHVAAMFGRSRWLDERYWYHSKHAFSLDAAGLLAFEASRLAAAVKGRSKKCLVLDLDNTLWGGVIGDDGLEGIRLGVGADGEAFVDFQRYVLSLKQRGIILAVCSKNEEKIALQPFEQHPEMVLRLEDIAVFVANWNNKADNIRQIAATLEIGLDAMVFVDDNPAERRLVQTELPMVAVPEMPPDPAGFIRALDRAVFFQTVAFSEEDRQRSAMYRGNVARKQLQRQITDLDAFLGDLDMEATAEDFDSIHLGRIGQLINKSNQFHPTTTRYTEARLKAMMVDPRFVCRCYRLKDRFGDNGLISAVIMEQKNHRMQIDTWVMSCRVLSRGMEDLIHNDLVAIARQRGCCRLGARYLPTAKNAMVADLYRRLGYRQVAENQGATDWELDPDNGNVMRPHCIRMVPPTRTDKE